MPQVSNNYRAKILHPQILSFFIIIFLSAGVFLSAVRTNFPSVLGISSNISIDELLIITNQKRQENGLPPLTLNGQLDSAALNKANDMLSKNYWSHIAPDGTTPWFFIKQSGYNFIYAGENLARGYNSANDVLNAWLASPTHRDNILSSKYKNVGFAIVTGNLTGEETVLVVEMFGSSVIATEDNLAKATVEETKTTQPTGTPTPSVAVVQITAPVINNQKEKLKSEEKATESAPAKTQKFIAKNTTFQIKPLINAQTFSSNIAVLAISVFAFVLTLDMVIIGRKRILRFVGHNLDHILFLGLVLSLVFVLIRGYII